ncbi:response regulator [Chromobacterium vaccinii]|uniref:response regulator n=1 Tax=Chromobacterium vaccinii TaxID=1108595 RepID=UPI000E192916|nr:response regulator [Chromobacterium vaccinii]SUX30612.1 Response regulator rcp1 [Chromobacterium vaccinii]
MKPASTVISPARHKSHRTIAPQSAAPDADSASYARSLLEASLNPLVAISAQVKITDVNAAMIGVAGRSRAEIVGTDFADYFTEPEQTRAGYQRIFLDLRMPKPNGMEALRRIKADERAKMIPVAALTSSKEDRDIVESCKLGADSNIGKSIHVNPPSQAVAQLGLYWLVVNQPPIGNRQP